MKPSKYNILIASGFTAACLILGAVAVVSLHTIRDFIDGSRRITHTHKVLANLDELLSLIKDAESGQRGFLISGDLQYLSPYRVAGAGIPARLVEIKLLTKDNPTQLAALANLDPLIQKRLTILDEGVRLKQGNASLTQILEALARGNSMMQQIQERAAQIRIEENRLLQTRSAQFEYDAVLTKEVIIIANLAALSILSLAAWALFGEIGKRTKAEKKFRAILEFAPDAIVMVDQTGTIVLVNAQAEKLFGYTRDELYQRPIEMLMAERYRNRHIEHRSTYSANPHLREMGMGLELFGRRKDGEEFPVEVSLGSFGSENGQLISSAIRDITDRKRSAQALYQSNIFLNSLIDNIPNMIFVKDAEALRFVRFNKAGERLLGYSREELIGKNDYDFFPMEEADFFTAKDKAVLVAGTLVDIPEESIHTKHQGVRILHTMKIPIIDEHGVPQYLLGISEDITDRKEAEREIVRLNKNLSEHAAQLEVSNRELESFSYSVSHDLRAPLRAIDGFARMLQDDYSKQMDDQGRRWLTVIRDNSGKMNQLIDDLLAFAHLGRKSIEPIEFDMTLLVHEVVAELGQVNKLQADIRISPLGNVWGDRALIKQVWANLISNAVKYSAGRPHPLVEIQRTENKDEVIFQVRDNGIGFEMQYYDKLFGVFERLHSAQDFAGTGVGLAIVQRIVVRHGGRVWAESRVDEGAIFYFTLRTGVVDVPHATAGDIAC
ncbi:MAG: PAS domain S-box protein [Pseudomonadota bacterium]